MKTEQRPVAAPVRQYQQIAFAAEDARESWQTAVAGAGRAGDGVVEDFISNEWHGEIGQGGDDHPPSLTGCAWRIGVIWQFDQELFGLTVIKTRMRTLQGDVADFFGAVAVDERNFEYLPAPFG